VKRSIRILAFVVAVVSGAAPARPIARGATAPCEGLAAIALPHSTITTAAAVEAGVFTPPGVQSLTVTRSFCRVVATVKPAADSNITVEVWLPARDWNGKLQAVGNGAFNGSISYGAMNTALSRGYAAASTDTGHTGGGAQWAIGHPEKVVDFGWRAVHEMAVVAKQIVAAYYGTGARYAYWNGCSAGGRQAMQEAQRFPEDFDGIVAGFRRRHGSCSTTACWRRAIGSTASPTVCWRIRRVVRSIPVSSSAADRPATVA
jgi:hypothetical protein